MAKHCTSASSIATTHTIHSPFNHLVARKKSVNVILSSIGARDHAAQLENGTDMIRSATSRGGRRRDLGVMLRH